MQLVNYFADDGIFSFGINTQERFLKKYLCLYTLGSLWYNKYGGTKHLNKAKLKEKLSMFSDYLHVIDECHCYIKYNNI